MGMRKGVPHAKCSPLCAIKEKLQELWDRAYGCINKINDITPDGDGKFTIQGGQNISITPISNGLAFDAVYPSGVLTINNQTPDADGDISGIATTDQLTDGSVTKVGTANVGSDTKPIKLVGGVPTAVTNDLVDVSSAQTISGAKTFSTNPTVKSGLNATDGYITLPTRAYDSANINDAVTIGSLAANPSVIHASGNESKIGDFKLRGQMQFENTEGTHNLGIMYSDRSGTTNRLLLSAKNGNNGAYLTLNMDDGGTATLRIFKYVNGVWSAGQIIATD